MTEDSAIALAAILVLLCNIRLLRLLRSGETGTRALLPWAVLGGLVTLVVLLLAERAAWAPARRVKALASAVAVQVLICVCLAALPVLA